jgi:hypothetical protein
MGRLWEDGFDHYGLDESNMLDGSYAQIGSGNSLSTAHPATGTHGMLIAGSPNLENTGSLRKVLPTQKTKLGVTGRLYFPTLPTQNQNAVIADFYSDVPTNPHLTCIVDSNGAVRFLRARDYTSINGENGILIAQTDPVVTAGAQTHFEIQVFQDATAGWVRVAINGDHEYQATGLNISAKFSGHGNIASIGQSGGAMSGGLGTGNYYLDDYIIYDFTGDPAVDTDFCPTVDAGTGVATNYIGELQVWPLFPNGDTAEADWAKSTGTSGYPLIGETTPDDSTYIYSTAAGDLSEFDLEDLPENITYIQGLSFHQRLSKSDAGSARTQVGMKSVAATSDADDRPVTVEPTYWRDMVNVDPDSSARWTRPSLNAAWLRLTRSV